MTSKLRLVGNRIIYGILLLSLVIPLIWPIGLPMTIPEEVEKLYEMIERLSPGSAVAISFDLSPGGYDELNPAAVAVMNHLARKGIRLIGMAFWDAGPNLFERTCGMSLYADKVYGTDYVNLGFLAGGENAMAAAARDIKGSFGRDFHGNNLHDMPILRDVDSFNDIELLIVVASGNPGVPEWIRQVGDPIGVPIATIVIAGLVADYAPYMHSRQLIGMVPGLRGAAGYESLIDMKGLGTAGLDAQSIAHIVILLLIVLGNVAFVLDRRQIRKGMGGY